MIEKNKITAIITSYKRPYALQEQVDAINAQTIKPEDIWVWHNEGGVPFTSPTGTKNIVCNHNFKFHGRFALGLLAKTEYVALFDDDTIPGNRWFENCMNSMKTNMGIYGTTGILLHRPNTYIPHDKIGWNGGNNVQTREVDLVGHAWVFKREWLVHLWKHEPVSWENGEDIQFSAYCKRQGIKTFVPPHPPNDLALWGSQPKTGMQYGMDKQAAASLNREGGTKKHYAERNAIVSSMSKQGWKIVRG